MRGVRLETTTWTEAERVLTPAAVVVIPLGAAAKEHGPHLPLNCDRLVADYLAQRVLDAAEVLVAPTITYHFYPAFVECVDGIREPRVFGGEPALTVRPRR